MIHPTADVQTKQIGENTKVWQYSVILPNAKIGLGCNINCHVFIENDVVIGDYVTIKVGVQIWDGIRIEDGVFIGPNVTFTNDGTPRSKNIPEKFQKTIIKSHASIGGGAVILGGHKIGAYALVGAGSVVTKDIPDRALVIGNPAKIVGWVNDDGSKMEKQNNVYIDKEGKEWRVENNKLIRI